MMRPATSPMAVVDDQLRVHGLFRLRVAGAAVMPTVVSGNTNAACIMFGKKCSEMILGPRLLRLPGRPDRLIDELEGCRERLQVGIGWSTPRNTTNSRGRPAAFNSRLPSRIGQGRAAHAEDRGGARHRQVQLVQNLLKLRLTAAWRRSTGCVCCSRETTMWQPDGWGWRARIGVLTPHGDIGPESEFRAMAPEGVSIHAARVPLGAYVPGKAGTMDRIIARDAVHAFAEPPLVDDAAELLAAAPCTRSRTASPAAATSAARPTISR